VGRESALRPPVLKRSSARERERLRTWTNSNLKGITPPLLQNGAPKPSISSFDQPEENPDGSVDILFGPQAPQDNEKNWIKTLPGQGWFTYIRLYGPLESFFDHT
jgi:hypothetical protein